MSEAAIGLNPRIVEPEDSSLITDEDTAAFNPISKWARKSLTLFVTIWTKSIEKMNLKEAIRANKSRRNSLAAISRLPSEVLSEIFLCHAAAMRGSMKWVQVSHVSRHWRAVAISCPYLWTHLVFTQPRWVEEMLERSKIALLVIDARTNDNSSRSMEAVHLAMNHISRVRELTITSASAMSLGELCQSVPKSAPMLQTLMLSVYLSDEYYTIPSDLFSDDISQLRCLELKRCNLDWASPLLKGLTHLKIHDIAPGNRPATALFLDVLEQLLTLKSLDLEGTLPEVADGQSIVSYQRTIELPSLTHLHISGSVSECSNALRHLSLSSSVMIRLSCRSTAASDTDFSGIPIFINGLWEPKTMVSSAAKQHNHPIRSLKIQGRTREGFNLRTWPTMLSFSDMSEYRESSPSINLSFKWSGNVDKVIRETCAALPLEELVLLDVSEMVQMEQQTWLESFGNLSHLRSIRVQGASVRSLVSAMTADPGVAIGTSSFTNSWKWQGARDGRATVLAVYFPSLLSLTIDEAKFDDASDNESIKLYALKECLIQRFERKAEVHELTLENCRRLSKDAVKELREIVVHVIWNGREVSGTKSCVSGSD